MSAATTSIKGAQGALACLRSTLKESTQLLAAAQNSTVTNWNFDPALQQLVALSATPVGVNGVDQADPLATVAPIGHLLTLEPGYQATVMVEHNLNYSTINDPSALGHVDPTTFEAAPFLIEVQRMIVDVTVVPQTSPPTLIPDPASAAQYHLLPFTAYNPATPAAGPANLTANGRLAFGPYASVTVPEYQRISLVWIHEAADWNNTAPDLGGWQILPFTNPFFNLGAAGQPALTAPTAISFDVRLG